MIKNSFVIISSRIHFRAFLFSFLFMSISILVFSQDKPPVTFGKVTPGDFVLPKSDLIDSNTNAVIIADVGATNFVGNNKGWFSYIFKRKKRIKILDKKGFDVATVKEYLYVNHEDKEELSEVNATTYNIENGKLTETRLAKNDVFEEKLDKNHFEKKFTLPGVKEGSIIEFSYTVKSVFEFNMRSWDFQHIGYPCLWSEYEVDIPNTLTYTFIRRGIHPFYINKSDGRFEEFHVAEKIDDPMSSERLLDVRAYVNRFRWVMKGVPAFNVESFIYSPKIYVDKIEFQLAKTYNGEESADVINTWDRMTAYLLNSVTFGDPLFADNSWLNEELDNLTKDEHDMVEQAKKIYYFISSNFNCTNYNSPYIRTNLEDVFKKRSGSVGDINLLLIAMLRQKHISANPVIFGTRDFGFNSSTYPLFERLNYVICKVNFSNQVYYLDACHPMLGFGRLDENCYNGYARIIGKEDPPFVYFNSGLLQQPKSTTVFIINDEKEKGLMSGSFESTPGYLESYNKRNEISKIGKIEFLKKIQQSYSSDIKVDNMEIDSLNLLEEPIKIHYDLSFKTGESQDIIYYSPVIQSSFAENPFKAAERMYPVEMPYPVDETYGLNMEIPAGYVVEELPKSSKVAYNGNEGFFEYLIQKSETNVQLRTHIKLNKATFAAEEYNSLRDFFAFVIKKQSEQIVFKKKK